MTVDVPLWLVIAQWVALCGLGLLVIVMYRQMGYYLALSETGAERVGVGAGQAVPEFDFVDATAGESRRYRFAGHRSLLLFVDPHCGGCERALASVDALRAKRRLAGVTAVVVTSAPPAEVAHAPKLRGRTDVAIVDRDLMEQGFLIERVPFAYLVDGDGIVRAKGNAETEAAIIRMVGTGGDRAVLPLVPVQATSAQSNP